VFGLNQFLDEAKTGKKRGLDTGAWVYLSDCLLYFHNQSIYFYSGGSRKRQQLDKATDRE
jgi:SNW domain-containing protein 1